TASACTVTEPDCKATHGGPFPLTLLPGGGSHLNDAGIAMAAQDFAGSADFTFKYQTTFEPFTDHMEVRIGDYRNLLYEIPVLQQDKLTVWWPVATREALVQKLMPFDPSVATATGSFLLVIVADCEGRPLSGAQVSAELTAGGSNAPP